jgi:hypothetical protein
MTDIPIAIHGKHVFPGMLVDLEFHTPETHSLYPQIIRRSALRLNREAT